MHTKLVGSCPETALFHQFVVNQRIRLCGVKHYASVQMLDFLDLAKSCWFPNSDTYLVLSGVYGCTLVESWSVNRNDFDL